MSPSQGASIAPQAATPDRPSGAGRSGRSGGAAIKTPVRRLSLNLSDAVYDELTNLAAQRHSSMTEIVRLALGLLKIAIHESAEGHRLVVTSETGEALKELVLPS